MKKHLLFLSILIMTSLVSAQSVGGSFMIGSPQGEFRTNVDRLGFGIQVHGLLFSPNQERPFSVGLNIGYLVYGSVNERRPWVGFPGVYLNLDRTNSIANMHLMFQISPFSGDIRPYVEGLFGGAYIFTESSVKNENGNTTIASSTNFDDFTWSYGGGVGMLICVGRNLGDVQKLFLDLKVRYMYGTEAEYLTEESVFINTNGDTIFRPQRSKTDLLTFHIGVVANFDL
jgi:hypothetical protein